MKIYIDNSAKIFAFESDGSQDALINPDMVLLTTNRPSQFHSPVIEDGAHTGEWILDEAAQRESSIPDEVSMAQGTAALIQADKWQAVLDFVEAITDPNAKALAEVALYKTGSWRRNSPFLKQVASAINLTETEMDDLFIAARQIEF